MQKVQDAIVEGGKITLSGLPFSDGQQVQVIVSDDITASQPKRSIAQVQALLKDGVVKYDDPFDTMIPEEHWEMLK